MCGRYALDQNARDLAAQFALPGVPELVPRYNIAPGSTVLAIQQRDSRRIAGNMSWGLEPAWARARGRAGGSPRPINARSETVASQPMFRAAFRSNRCVLPATGFYEWQRLDDGPKQPFFFRAAAGSALAMAGLFEPADAGAAPTCCILTRLADAVVLPVHDRMPFLLDAAEFDLWLDPAAAAADLRALLAGPSAVRIEAHPVSVRVNDTHHDDPGLIRPLAAGTQP
jgi:putative SOS response-associated peptidase YedK